MPESNREVLATIFADVLESLAFMFADAAVPADLAAPSDGAVAASMAYTGMFNGTLRMAVPRDLCLDIAANILGVDPEDERAMEKARDALKELLNVTCGNFLTAVAGEEPVFDLCVPETDEIDADAWDQMSREDGAVGFTIEDRPVLLLATVDTVK